MRSIHAQITTIVCTDKLTLVIKRNKKQYKVNKFVTHQQKFLKINLSRFLLSALLPVDKIRLLSQQNRKITLSHIVFTILNTSF